jgi:membrane peptidoglycan carboxypeptidase
MPDPETSSIPPPKPRKRKQLRAPTQRRSWFTWQQFGLFFGRLAIAVSIVAAVALGIVYWHYNSLAAGYDLAKLGAMPERTIVYDRNGEVIGRLYGENRIKAKLTEVSPHMVKAILAREDARASTSTEVWTGVEWPGQWCAT